MRMNMMDVDGHWTESELQQRTWVLPHQPVLPSALRVGVVVFAHTLKIALTAEKNLNEQCTKPGREAKS